MKTRGFTLIELAIVVAIMGILASIAIPNFLRFQCEARAERVGISTGKASKLCRYCTNGCNEFNQAEAIERIVSGKSIIIRKDDETYTIIGKELEPTPPVNQCEQESERLIKKIERLQRKLDNCNTVPQEQSPNSSWKE